QVDVGARLQSSAEARLGATHPFANGADQAGTPGQEGDDAIGLAQFLGAQHNTLVTVETHTPIVADPGDHPRMRAAPPSRACGEQPLWQHRFPFFHICSTLTPQGAPQTRLPHSPSWRRTSPYRIPARPPSIRRVVPHFPHPTEVTGPWHVVAAVNVGRAVGTNARTTTTHVEHCRRPCSWQRSRWAWRSPRL